MVWLAAAAAFLVPLVLTPRALFYYDITPKVVLILLAAATALAAIFFQWNGWAAYARTRWGRWYLVAVAASGLIAGFAALRSAERGLAWYGSDWRRMGALTEGATILAAAWIAQLALQRKRNLFILLRAISVAGLLASLYGIAQYLNWDPILPRDAYAVGEGVFQIVRPPGTLGHSDYFAAYLLWPVFAGWALSLVEQSFAWGWLGRISGGAASAAIVLSGSRGALLGLVAGVAVRLFLKRARWGHALTVTLAAAAVFAGFYLSPAGERMRARVHWIAEDRVGGARLLLWRDSLRMAEHKPLTGFGPEAFVAEFPRFESEALARAYPDFFHESPHNLLLDVLTSEGLLGLLALAAVVGIAAGGGLESRGSNIAAALAFLPGLAASLLAHQFAAWIAPSAFYFYMGTGVLAGAGEEKPAVDKPPLTPLWRSAVALAGCAGAIFFAVAAYRLTAEDGMLARVDRRLDAGDFPGAAMAYRAALNRPDAGVTADLYFSRRWSKLAMATTNVMPKVYYSQIAAAAASRATRQPEQAPNAWYNLSLLAAARNDPAGTEYALRAAITCAPEWYKPHWILAQLLAVEGRSAEAAPEAARALQLNGGKDSEVASTLAQVLRSTEPRP